MKKLAILVSIVGFAAAISFLPKAGNAEGEYGMAGCGLGSQAMGKKAQLFAATTNSTSGSKYFGITSGTSNCTDDGIILARVNQKVFVNSNFENLQLEMAKGVGENLSALANIMGCQVQDVNRFGKFTKVNYKDIVSKDSSPDQMLNNIKDLMLQDQYLKTTCDKISI